MCAFARKKKKIDSYIVFTFFFFIYIYSIRVRVYNNSKIRNETSVYVSQVHEIRNRILK